MAVTSNSHKRVVTGICGDGRPYDEYNPSFVTRQKWAPELLYVLNKCPMSAERISSELGVSENGTEKLLGDLVRIKAVEERSGIYRVTFPIFTKEDLTLLARATEPIANKLARRISSHEKEITSLAKTFHTARQVEVDKILFAVVGCFVLDWMGLKSLKEEGFLIISKPQPGNRDYLLFAKEKLDQNTTIKLYDKMYWGSHSDELDPYFFTSFGDKGARYAFPDVVWNLQASTRTAETLFKSVPWMTEKIITITQMSQEKLLRDAASLLFRIDAKGPIQEKEMNMTRNKWQSNLICLLEDMNYIIREKETIKLNYPVFVADDKKIIDEIVDILIPSVLQVIHQNYLNIKKELGSISPLKNNIPLNEVFTEVWHWIFAQTNKILAERGIFHDPPKKRKGESRSIAWISKFKLPLFN